MTAKDVMKTDVVTCGPESDLAAAARLMRRHKIGFLPVVDNHGSVVGVFTGRDISNAGADKRAARQRSVNDVMRHPVYTCRPGDNLKAVLATMAEYRVRRLPVLDEEDRALIGVVSIDDIVQALRAICREERLAESATR
jgi:CBS domain-containing protein